MHSLAKIAFSVLFWGLVFAELCWKRPIKNDNGFALPKYRKILPLNVFNDKVRYNYTLNRLSKKCVCACMRVHVRVLVCVF